MAESQERFPIAFLEAGTDDDQSYCSMKLIRQENGCLKIDVARWAIEGASLEAWRQGSTLELQVIVECLVGVETVMIEKVALSHLLQQEQESELREIQLCGAWKLAISKTR